MVPTGPQLAVLVEQDRPHRLTVLQRLALAVVVAVVRRRVVRVAPVVVVLAVAVTATVLLEPLILAAAVVVVEIRLDKQAATAVPVS
jgi:hypothetical protein